MKAKLGLFSLVCALVLSLSYGEKTMSNNNPKTWFELLAEDASLLQGDNLIGSREGNLEEILQLSIQMIKTGTTTFEELKRLGELEELHMPKETALPDEFSFKTKQPAYYATITVDLGTKNIKSVWLSKDSDIDRNMLNLDNTIFIKNEFLIYKEEDARGIYYEYRITQKYHLRDNSNIIIKFLKDYNSDEKETFEYFQANPDKLHLFSDVVVYRQGEVNW